MLVSRGRVLLGHSTRPHRKVSMTDEFWTISKGEMDKGETQEQTALREFREETSIDLQALGLDIAHFTEYCTKSKRNTIFICRDPDGRTLGISPKCTTMVPVAGYPEIDAFHWATPSEARKMVFPSQQVIFSSDVI